MKIKLHLCILTILCLNFALVAQNIQPNQLKEHTTLVRKKATQNTDSLRPQKTRKNAKIQHINNSIIWGAGALVGSADGEFANDFVEATLFTPGDNPTSWTAQSISENYGNTTPGAAYWTRNTLGYLQGAFWGDPIPITSDSQANGFAAFDSDFLDNGGDDNDEAIGSGTSPAGQVGSLISPRIDLTGYSNKPLAIRFFSFYRDFDITALNVGLSLDDGATFTDVNYMNVGTDEAEEYLIVPFVSTTAGVNNLTQCRIRFTFDGDYYFAIVDDVSISEYEVPNYDLTVGPSTTTGVASEVGDQAQITSNSVVSITQLSNDLIHKGFGAYLTNLGEEEVKLSLNPRIELKIERDNTGSWETVYTQSIPSFASLEKNRTLLLDASISDDSWMTVGAYRVTYTAALDGIEEDDESNNTLQHFFTVTPDTLVSKVPVDEFNNPIATIATFPADETPSAIEFGSLFSFNDVEGENFNIESLNLTYFLSDDFDGEANQKLYAHIYKVEASGFLLAIGEDNTELIANAEINLNSLDTALREVGISASSTRFMSEETGEILTALPSSGLYLVTVEVNPSKEMNTTTTFDADDVPNIGVNTTKNYILNNNYFNRPNGHERPAILKLTDADDEDVTFMSGYGNTLVPALSLNTRSNYTTTGPRQFDVKLNSLNTDKYFLTNATIPLEVEVFNNTTNPVTSIDLNWNDGTDHIATLPVAIGVGQSVVLEHPTSLVISEVGEKKVLISVLKVNGVVDENATNSSVEKYFYAVSKNGNKKVLIEEGTGTWCGWCPRGLVAMKNMYQNFSDQFVGIAVHNSDPMENKDYEEEVDFNAYPQMNVDRIFLRQSVTQSSMETTVNTLRSKVTPVDVEISASIENRNLTVTPKANFFTNVSEADFRFSVIVLENNVTGTTNGYAQRNFFSGGGNGEMEGYEDLADPVPANLMTYNHVGTALLGGYHGVDGSIATEINNNQEYEYTFNYTIPDDFDTNEIQIVVLVLDNEDGSVVNSNTIFMNDVTLSSKNVINHENFSLYPNPATEFITVTVPFDDSFTLNIYNLNGSVVLSKNLGKMTKQETSTVDVSTLSSGNYLLSLEGSNSLIAKQIIIK
ncbi:Omp28-related outer membrane protein [Wenyingzhuangia sp. IMCC45533]